MHLTTFSHTFSHYTILPFQNSVFQWARLTRITRDSEKRRSNSLRYLRPVGESLDVHPEHQAHIVERTLWASFIHTPLCRVRIPQSQRRILQQSWCPLFQITFCVLIISKFPGQTVLNGLPGHAWASAQGSPLDSILCNHCTHPQVQGDQRIAICRECGQGLDAQCRLFIHAFVSLGCQSQIPQIGQLNRKKFISLQFQRLEVQDLSSDQFETSLSSG